MKGKMTRLRPNLAALSNFATAAFTLFVYECKNMMAGLLSVDDESQYAT